MLQTNSESPSRGTDPTRELLRGLLAELLTRLEVAHENAQIVQALNDVGMGLSGGLQSDATTTGLMRVGSSLGLRLIPTDITSESVWELLLEDFLIAMVNQDGSGEPCAWVLSHVVGGRAEVTKITVRGKESDSLNSRAIRRLLRQHPNSIFHVVEPSLLCDAISAHRDLEQSSLAQVNDSHDPDHHEHEPSPLRRYWRLLSFDKRDIWTLAIFSIVASILNLAIPLAVEQMVTTIGFAMVIQPLIWIAVALFAILTLSAIIKALQLFVVEILQRRIMVRVVGDLSERFTRLERSAIDGIHGPELANRFFDVITLQKATASLLIDVLALSVQTLAGLLLLAVYSPYLLMFDVVLIMLMTVFLYGLGRGAVKTAIEESLIKYRIAHWLQDVIGNSNAFQIHGGGELSVDRANRLVVEYLGARRRHFIVLIRQSLFALMLYAISISALLSLGGWLVINDAITIGMLVASVSVVAVVVGAFSQVGKSLESFYDLMAATNKVGHMIDLPTIPPSRPLDAGIGPVEVRSRELAVGRSHHGVRIPNFHVAPGQRAAVLGEGRCGKTMLIETLAGLRSPLAGVAEIGGIDSRDVNRFADGSMVSASSGIEVFNGSVQDAVTLNRISISQNDVREALQLVELWDEVLALPNGLDTLLQTGGFPLSQSQTARLMLARALVSKPRLLLIDGTLDLLPPRMRHRIWERISSVGQPWTLLLTTHDPKIIEACSKAIELIPTLDDHTHA
ncbi:MAG: ATP-binding cassette domain-containing protein [Planctomycetota bacterium]